MLYLRLLLAVCNQLSGWELAYWSTPYAVGQDYRIGTAWKMSVDIGASPDLLLVIQQKLGIVQYRYGSLSQ